LTKYYEDHPFRVIIFAALFFRLLAVIFSKGFGWIDDQFLVIEIAQSWVDGTDFYNWLPHKGVISDPKGFSFFYTGLHYILFKILEFFKLTDPQGKMYVVRLLHALWSLLTVFYGFKIANHFGNKKNAIKIAWLLAIFWIFPFLSVRNLVEFVCVPFLMYGTWKIIDTGNKTSFLLWLWIGVVFGLAFNIRIQSALYTTGVGIVLLYQKKWRQLFILGLGFLLPFVLLQGGIDYLVWGKPFIQMQSYIIYNMHHSHDYITGPWYNYLLFLLLALIPPVSIYLLTGTIVGSKKMLILFIPVILFLLFHSWYPNKQERFISTIIPFLMIIGVIGWNIIEDGILNPAFIKKWIRGSWVFFWIINSLLLIFVSTMYSKKARVESMSYLSKYKSNTTLIVENSVKDEQPLLPLFYLKRWTKPDIILKGDDFEKYSSQNNWGVRKIQPGFVLFYQPNHLQERVEKMKTLFPELVYETTIEPGMLDKLLHWLNPINDNQNIYIYRNRAVIKDSIN